MRSRWAILAAALVLACITTAPALAAAPRHVLAQSDSGDAETQGGDTSGGSGQSDAEAKTGSESDASTPAEPETGPPWTYQMARITVVLSLLLALAIFRWYWKLVGSRQKGAA